MQKKGVVFERMHFPSRLKIEMEKVDDDKWTLHYIESFDKEIPPEDAMLSIEMAKKLGVQIRRRGNSFSYKITGPKEILGSVILGEFMTMTRLGHITLNEIFALAVAGLPNVIKMAEMTTPKLADKEH